MRAQAMPESCIAGLPGHGSAQPDTGFGPSVMFNSSNNLARVLGCRERPPPEAVRPRDLLQAPHLPAAGQACVSLQLSGGWYRSAECIHGLLLCLCSLICMVVDTFQRSVKEVRSE